MLFYNALRHGIVVAASRSKAAARLEDRRVLEERAFPPDILFPGERQSQDVKCLALGHAFKSRPHSLTSFRASEGPNPWIWVRSTPSMPYRAARTSKAGALTCFVRTRALDRGFAGLSTSSIKADIDASKAAPKLRLKRERAAAHSPARRFARCASRRSSWCSIRRRGSSFSSPVAIEVIDQVPLGVD